MRPETPSNTARIVARGLFLASKHESLARLLAPRSAGILAQIPEVTGGWFGRVTDWRAARRALFVIERLMLPGIIAHYLARKRWIEEHVREALAAGAGRVVVIGAGFDTLAWRLHTEFPEVRFVELDHTATQGVKTRALGQARNIRFLSVDLASSGLCPETLAEPEVKGPTVVIIEGVTMYLDEAQVSALLTQCAKLAGTGGTLLFTFMEMDARGSVAFRNQSALVRWWLNWRGEPFCWGISRPALAPFLKACGLGAVDLTDHTRMRKTVLALQGLQDIPLAEGECLCSCQPIRP